MKLYSQRNSKWSSLEVGTGGKTIGEVGCTISCLGMGADITPEEVNERMNRVGGYTNGNLVTWSKIKEAIPWMEFEWRGYGYDNNKVLEAIGRNGFCLVEVDGSRIGGTTHWVLYIGGGQMYDPYYGTQKATSYYKATGYAIVNRIGEPESDMYRGYDLTNEESMKICVDDHIKISEGELVSKGELNECQKTVERLQGEKGTLEKQIKKLGDELGSVRADLATTLKAVETKNNIIKAYVEEDAVQLGTITTYERERNECREGRFEFLRAIREDLKLSSTIDDTGEAENEALVALRNYTSGDILGILAKIDKIVRKYE